MAKKVFAVYLAKEGAPNSEAFAKLDLPASPWELWDAMEKVRLKDDKALYMEIDDYYAFEYRRRRAASTRRPFRSRVPKKIWNPCWQSCRRKRNSSRTMALSGP